MPMEELRKFDIDENTIVEITITKEESPLRETFGTAKFKKTTKEMLEESDKEAWDE